LPVLRTDCLSRRRYALRTQGERIVRGFPISFTGAEVDTKAPPEILAPKTQQQQYSQVEIKATQPRFACSLQERWLFGPPSREATKLQSSSH